MSNVCIFFATGFEEIEALTVVDILRRANITAEMVSVTGEKEVTGSHGISVKMDKLWEEGVITQEKLDQWRYEDVHELLRKNGKARS